jgi:hypothetical protein
MSNQDNSDASLTDQDIEAAEASIDAEQESIDAANKQASIDASDLLMFRAMHALQKTPPATKAPVKPIRGGIEGKYAWTGGSTVNPRTSPLTPDCYRDATDLKLMRLTHARCTEGLPESKRLDVGTGPSGAGGGNTTMVAWLTAFRLFAQDTGQDAVFYLQDKDGVERSLLTHSGMFTTENAKTHCASLADVGDTYDMRNMETSGVAMMNSIGPTLHADLQKFITGNLLGPVIFMMIVDRIQSSSASVWRNVVTKLRKMRLNEEPGENVDTFSDKITGYCSSLEGANKLPEDITVILAEAFAACTVEVFRIKFLNIFERCDEDPGCTTWQKEVEVATSSFRRLIGRELWIVDVPRGGALGMAGGLVPGNAQSGDGPPVCYNCGSPDHFQRSCTAAGGNGSRGGAVSTWKSSPPATGASEHMRKFEKDYYWCDQCKSWNLSHKTGAHQAGIGRRGPAAGTGTSAGAGAPAPAVPSEAAGMVAPMTSDFSLIQFGGFACTPAGDWYSADVDDKKRCADQDDKTELKD